MLFLGAVVSKPFGIKRLEEIVKQFEKRHGTRGIFTQKLFRLQARLLTVLKLWHIRNCILVIQRERRETTPASISQIPFFV